MDPARFGKYRLQERIALGGMAEVFRAVAEGPAGVEKVVALKRILPLLSGAGEFVTMFIDEARIAASLTHVNIAQVLEFGEVNGQFYLAMELVEGADLARLADAARALGRRLSPAEVAFIVGEAARGLAYAHDKRGADGNPLGIVHRDVSPQNILISYAGEVKLADFGIAKAIGKLHKTESGAVMGKLRYMSPEQVLGEPLDGRSDLFALGVVMHEMLTGRTLFDGDNPGRVAEQVKLAEAKPPSASAPSVPAELDRVCAKLLARAREERYERAAEVARDLAKLASSVTREDLGALVQELVPRGAAPTHDEGSAPTEVAVGPPSPASGSPRPAPIRQSDANAPTRAERKSKPQRRWILLGAVAMAPLAAAVAWKLSAVQVTPAAVDLAPAVDAAGPDDAAATAQAWPRLPEAERARLAAELKALPLEGATRRGVPIEEYEAVLSAVDGALCASANPAEPTFPPEVTQRVAPLRLDGEARALARYVLGTGELPPDVDGPFRSFLSRNPAWSPGPPGWALGALATVIAPSPERLVDLMRENSALRRWRDRPPGEAAGVRFAWLCDRAQVVDAFARARPGPRADRLRRFLAATPPEATADAGGFRVQLTGSFRDEAAATLELRLRLTNPGGDERTPPLAGARLAGVDSAPTLAPAVAPLGPGGARDQTLLFTRITDENAEAAVLLLGGVELQAHTELLR
jgi:serine/threonine protein kinase